MGSIRGVGKLIVFILRRDRIYLPLWILGLVGLAVFFVPMVPDFFGDEQSKAVLVEMMKNPAMVAMIGIAYGDSMGAMFALFMLVWGTLATAIFNILFTLRHTRKDEEEGRSESIAALPVGRNANLVAVLLVALAANVLFALLTALVIPSFGVEDIGGQGALVFSFAMGAGGWVFAAITALFAQLFSTSKSTMIWAFVLLGTAYLLRAVGDMDSSYEIVSLISPLGLVERTQAWVQNEIGPILVLVVEALVFSAAAFAVSSLRDTGAGLIAPRNGRAQASALLSSEWGLAWRLTRGIFIGWTLVMLILGASYGSVFNDMQSFMENNEVYATILGGSANAQEDLVHAFVSFLEMLMAIVAAIPVCLIILKLKSEEKHGRLEQVLARSVSRTRLMSGFVLIALILSVVLIICTPVGMYAAAASMMEAPPAFDVMLLASFNYLPAMLAVTGLAVFLVGIAPKLTSALWGYISYCFILAYMGNMMESSAAGEALKDVFEVLLKTSPFSLLPAWPVHDVDVVLMVGMLIVAGALGIAGFMAYQRRDIG